MCRIHCSITDWNLWISGAINFFINWPRGSRISSNSREPVRTCLYLHVSPCRHLPWFRKNVHTPVFSCAKLHFSPNEHFPARSQWTQGCFCSRSRRFFRASIADWRILLRMNFSSLDRGMSDLSTVGWSTTFFRGNLLRLIAIHASISSGVSILTACFSLWARTTSSRALNPQPGWEHVTWSSATWIS